MLYSRKKNYWGNNNLKKRHSKVKKKRKHIFNVQLMVRSSTSVRWRGWGSHFRTDWLKIDLRGHKRFILPQSFLEWMKIVWILCKLAEQRHILKPLSKLIMGPETAAAPWCMGWVISEKLLTQWDYLSWWFIFANSDFKFEGMNYDE